MAEPDHGATDAPGVKEGTDGSSTQSYTALASSAAGTAAETATNAATGVKDTMFSMFGGGAKKEASDGAAKDEEQDRSGSAKALKEKEKEKIQETSRDDHDEHEGVSQSATEQHFRLLRFPARELSPLI